MNTTVGLLWNLRLGLWQMLKIPAGFRAVKGGMISSFSVIFPVIKAGISQEEIDKIMMGNPRKMLIRS